MTDNNFSQTICHQGQAFLLRLAVSMDSEQYYQDCFCPIDTVVASMTGSKAVFDKEEVVSFFLKSLLDDNRRWLLLFNHQQKIIAECVFMEIQIHHHKKQAHFRMAVFDKDYRYIGLGKLLLLSAMDYGFDELNLDVIELEVYEYNQAAYRLYLSIGFKVVGYNKNEIIYNNQYYGKYLMTLSKNNYYDR